MGQPVVIFSDNGISRVVPDHRVADKREEITFMTINTAATIMIPNAGRFEDGSNVAHIPEGGRAVFIVDDTNPGVYPYAVFCEETNNFAVGNSSPDLIVY